MVTWMAVRFRHTLPTPDPVTIGPTNQLRIPAARTYRG